MASTQPVKSTSPFEFSPFCCQCFDMLTSSNPGRVLSCGDFVCSVCSANGINSCPGCGKVGVNSVKLNEKKPEQVEMNLSDASNTIKTFSNILNFQLRHYKQTLMKLSKKYSSLKKCFDDSQNQVIELRELLKLSKEPRQLFDGSYEISRTTTPTIWKTSRGEELMISQSSNDANSFSTQNQTNFQDQNESSLKLSQFNSFSHPSTPIERGRPNRNDPLFSSSDDPQSALPKRKLFREIESPSIKLSPNHPGVVENMDESLRFSVPSSPDYSETRATNFSQQRNDFHQVHNIPQHVQSTRTMIPRQLTPSSPPPTEGTSSYFPHLSQLGSTTSLNSSFSQQSQSSSTHSIRPFSMPGPAPSQSMRTFSPSSSSSSHFHSSSTTSGPSSHSSRIRSPHMPLIRPPSKLSTLSGSARKSPSSHHGTPTHKGMLFSQQVESQASKLSAFCGENNR